MNLVIAAEQHDKKAAPHGSNRADPHMSHTQLEKIIIVRTPRGAKSASNKNRLDRPRPNEGLLVGWREWANRGRPFGHRIPTDIGGTALRAVTTYPTLFGQDEVSDFHSNCLCASGRGTEGVQRALP